MSEDNLDKNTKKWSGFIEDKSREEIAHLLAEIEEKAIKSEERATKDGLTGLKNRQEVEAEFPRFAELAKEFQKPIYILFFDMDDFKKINDTEGHAAGDAVLVKCANVLKESFRDSDLFGRWGGDEFVGALAINEEKDREGGIESFLNRLLSKLQTEGLSVSIGMAEYTGFEDLESAVDKADRNMSVDKRARNKSR